MRSERKQKFATEGTMSRKKIKVCKFCAGEHKRSAISYKDAGFLRAFTTEKGKILPRRISGCCASHQRLIAAAIKRSRHAALLPFQAD